MYPVNNGMPDFNGQMARLQQDIQSKMAEMNSIQANARNYVNQMQQSFFQPATPAVTAAPSEQTSPTSTASQPPVGVQHLAVSGEIKGLLEKILERLPEPAAKAETASVKETKVEPVKTEKEKGK